jgi:hypothetical protein
MRRWLMTALLPIAWVISAYISFLHPGDEYGLFFGGAIAGAWIAPFLHGLGHPREYLPFVLVTGLVVHAVLGFVLDWRRVSRPVWLAFFAGSTLALAALGLMSFPSLERAVAKNGSITAYFASAATFSLGLASLMALPVHVLSGRRYRVPAVFPAAFVANVALDLLSWLMLPARAAIHFGLGGRPDNWASREAYVGLMIGLHVFLFAMLYLTPRLVLAMPPRWVNLPHKEYWFAEGNRGRMRELLAHRMGVFGGALFLFMFVANLFAIQANLGGDVRLREGPFLAALAAFLVYTAVWVVGFYRAFRPPPASVLDSLHKGENRG